MMGSVGSVFVDRSKTEGNSELLKRAIEDHTALPLAIAPEGKISNGDLVFRFRSGGFRAEEEIQPLALRYYRVFPQLGCTLCWLSDSAVEYFCQAFPSVGYVAEATFLEPIKAEQLKGKTPQERADMVQLAIANYLGTLAIDQTTKACFQAKEKPE
jgi:1-acyl-sn-glycerol-3-phosphate acyltransferase